MEEEYDSDDTNNVEDSTPTSATAVLQFRCRIGPWCLSTSTADRCTVKNCSNYVHIDCSNRLKAYLRFEHYPGVICGIRCYEIYTGKIKDTEETVLPVANNPSNKRSSSAELQSEKKKNPKKEKPDSITLGKNEDNEREYERLRFAKMEEELKMKQNERMFTLLSQRQQLKDAGVDQNEIDCFLPLPEAGKKD